jgi:hypothetical protein
MTRFKLRKAKNGLFEILGLDKYIASKLAVFAPKTNKAAAHKPEKVKRPSMDPTLAAIEKALSKHGHRKQLLAGGIQKDQLLRSLVPLYLARNLNLEINSGIISRFWKLHGVSYATPNAAKALRLHVGYAREKGNRRQITPNGVKYVEDQLFKRRAA